MYIFRRFDRKRTRRGDGAAIALRIVPSPRMSVRIRGGWSGAGWRLMAFCRRVRRLCVDESCLHQLALGSLALSLSDDIEAFAANNSTLRHLERAGRP